MTKNKHIGIVTNNLVGPDGEPFKQGEVMFQCFTLLSDMSEYPLPAIPGFMLADPLGFGYFIVPAVGANIEIELDQDEYGSSVEVRYHCALYNSVNDIPAEFKTNYPLRKGFKFKSGLFLFDDTPGQELIQLIHLLGHGIQFTKDGDVLLAAIRNLQVDVLKDAAVAILGDLTSTTMGKADVAILDAATAFIVGKTEATLLDELTLAIAGKLTTTLLDELVLSAVKKITLSCLQEMVLSITGNITASTSGALALTAAVSAVLSSPLLKLGSAGATQPLVLGLALMSFLASNKIWNDTHTHNPITGLPNNPSPTPAGLLSTKILGE